MSRDYIAVETNFIHQMELNSAFTRHDLYLMCMDEESRQYFEFTLGFDCILLAGFNFRSNSDIWKLRIHVMSCLVSEWVPKM